MNTEIDERELLKQQKALKVAVANIVDLCEDDDQLLADMLEGSTGIFEFTESAASHILDDETLSKAISERIKDLQSRKKRIDERAQRFRVILAQLLDQAEQKTVVCPSGTVSSKPVKPSPIITSEADIPSKYWKPQPPKLDRSELRKDLSDNIKIPGAELGNGSVTVAIRSV